jgi:hypothetical protein
MKKPWLIVRPPFVEYAVEFVADPLVPLIVTDV